MDKILDIIDTLPVWVKASSVFTLLPLYMFKKPISELIKTIKLKWFFNPGVANITKEDLVAHDFFRCLQEERALTSEMLLHPAR